MEKNKSSNSSLQHEKNQKLFLFETLSLTGIFNRQNLEGSLNLTNLMSKMLFCTCIHYTYADSPNFLWKLVQRKTQYINYSFLIFPNTFDDVIQISISLITSLFSFKLKSLIAALHSSCRINGTQRKDFDLYEVNFGWQVLKDLWQREMTRAKHGKMIRVPQLCYRHIYRDCWTRLDVKPAKIMQVCVPLV